MKKITNIIADKDFTVSIEIVPPRNGTNPEEIFSKIETIKDKVDFFSVTKGAGGSLRGGTLPISHFIQERFGKNVIAHFVCREKTSQEIENDLVDLHYFKIKNVLALRGDPPAGSEEEWSGGYKYAYLLAEQIKNMNEGNYIPRNESERPFKKGIKTDFCTLVAGHPEDPIEQEIIHIKKKIESGAEAIITQMIFSFEDYENYVTKLREVDIQIPIIPGIRPVITTKQIESVENFFGISVCDKLKIGINEHKDFGIKYFQDFLKKLREHKAPGVHFFVLNDMDIVSKILGG